MSLLCIFFKDVKLSINYVLEIGIAKDLCVGRTHIRKPTRSLEGGSSLRFMYGALLCRSIAVCSRFAACPNWLVESCRRRRQLATTDVTCQTRLWNGACPSYHAIAHRCYLDGSSLSGHATTLDLTTEIKWLAWPKLGLKGLFRSLSAYTL
jgi:hypothetical protein